MNAEAAIAGSPDYFAKLAYQHTIPRELTHKRRLENVYLTSLNRVSQQEFLVGAYVPHANTFVNDMRCDPNDVTLTIVEIGRQIGIALSHEFLGVRYDNAFVLRDMEVEVLPAMRAIDWPENETLYAQALIDEQKFLETGELASARANVLFYVGEQCVCRQSSNSYVQQQSRYLKLRELTRTKHARSLKLYGADAPGLSGGFKIRTHSALKRPVIEDTLWAASDANKFIATLRVDRDNRFFFDHDNDHV